jgi:hypothetical protein
MAQPVAAGVVSICRLFWYVYVVSIIELITRVTCLQPLKYQIVLSALSIERSSTTSAASASLRFTDLNFRVRERNMTAQGLW